MASSNEPQVDMDKLSIEKKPSKPKPLNVTSWQSKMGNLEFIKQLEKTMKTLIPANEPYPPTQLTSSQVEVVKPYPKQEQLSKPLKVTDGVLKVGIVVDSIENLEERSKQALNLPQSLLISIKTQESKLIKSKVDLDDLTANEILTIIPKGPINFTPENLLKRLKMNPKSLVLFTDRDFVTISEINIKEFGNQYPPKHLEKLKKIAEEHIAKDQELRDTFDLVELSKISKRQEKGNERPSATKNPNLNVQSICYSPVALKQILENVKKDYGQIFKISDEELEALAFMGDGDEMILVDKQIKAAASRRLRIKRHMKLSKEYLLSNNQNQNIV